MPQVANTVKYSASEVRDILRDHARIEAKAQGAGSVKIEMSISAPSEPSHMVRHEGDFEFTVHFVSKAK